MQRKWISRELRIGKKVIAAVVVLAVLGVVARFALEASVIIIQRRGKPPDATPPPPEEVRVEVVRPQPQVRDVLELPAVVEPNRVVAVSAEVAGRIERIPFEEGAGVKAGDPLVFLNTDLLQADYDRALAEEKYAREHADRMVRLCEQGAVPEDQRDRATSARDVARAVLATAKARLDRATILCPIDGALNSVLVEEGEYIDSGKAVAELVDVRTVKVVVRIPERDVDFFYPGADAEVEVESSAYKAVMGTITYISELADQHTRTTRMEVTVDNNPRLLRSGQIVNVRLTRRVLRDAIMVPLHVVIPLESGQAAYVVEDGVAQRRQVRLGLRQGQMVQVESGLEAGDLLIVAGHRFVGPGQAVTVVTSEEGAAAGPGEGAQGGSGNVVERADE